MSASGERSVRYQPDAHPPIGITLGLGLQYTVLIIARIVVVPMVVVRAAGGGDDWLSWCLFASVLICGLTTALQAVRIGHIGSGYVGVMGTSLAVVGVAVSAVIDGGPALLATLVVVASIIPLILSARLALFRRILTPTVSGTVIMLIPVTLMPSALGLLEQVPADTIGVAAPIMAFLTLLAIVIVTLTGNAALRLWSPVIGVVVGSVVAVVLGLYDFDTVSNARWIGLPSTAWPGLDLEFGPPFWGLLPAFLLVSLIESVQTISTAAGAQRASWRRTRAVDYRAIQGAVATAGVGNILSGIAGTVPNTLLATSVAITELTGAAARRIGVAVGAVFIVMALLPKALAIVLAVPGPVVAAYLLVLMATMFLVGVKMIVQGGLDQRNGLIVGVAFWVGAGFHYGAIFPVFAAEFVGGVLSNGVTAGGVAAILMTLILEATKARRLKMETTLMVSSLPRIRAFLGTLTSRTDWDEHRVQRIVAAAEETLLALIEARSAMDEEASRILITARREGTEAVLEFAVAGGEDNLEDRIALLGEETGQEPDDSEVSIQLLSHLASSIRHEQYHDIEIVTVRVSGQ